MKEPSPQTKKFFGVLICGISGVALLMGVKLLWDVLPSCIQYREPNKRVRPWGLGFTGGRVVPDCSDGPTAAHRI